MKRMLSIVLSVLMLFCAVPNVLAADGEDLIHPDVPKDADGRVNGKEIIVYFPDWGVYSNYMPNSIDWERSTIVNHAFALVGTAENYEKVGVKEDGEPIPGDAEFVLKVGDTYAAEQMSMPHSQKDGLRGIFGEYKWYKENGYEDTKLYLSVGGWSYSFYFSEMIETQENRSEFITSCMDFLDKYPFFDGFDFDWEYPGEGRSAPELKGIGDGTYWPQVTGRPEDKENYTLFLKEMRQALDAREEADGKRYGMTACFASSTYGSTCYNYDEIVNYLDYFNVMTYCYDAPAYTGKMTGHGSNLYATDYNSFSAEQATELYLSRGIPPHKLNIGASATAVSWGGVVPDDDGNVVHVTSSGKPGANNDCFYSYFAKLIENGTFKYGFDENAQAAYAYNPQTQEYLSVDDVRSMRAKAGYINDNSLGGIIVWESRGDYMRGKPLEHPLIDALYECFVKEIGAPKKPGKAETTLTMKLGSEYAILNGERVQTTEYANARAKMLLVSSSAMIPLRFVCEAAGLEVSYDEQTNCTRVKNLLTGESLKVFTGTNRMEKTDMFGGVTDITAPAPALLINNISYIPVRTLLENMGFAVYWNEYNGSGYVIVSSSQQGIQLDALCARAEEMGI